MKFPEILERHSAEAGQLGLKLLLPAGLLYFVGHFPEAPILPGVVQIDWARHYARELLGLKGDFKAMEALKFQQVLRPGDEVELRLDWTAATGRLKFQYLSQRGRHSSGVLCFQPADV